jgi:hypothetical protein
LTFRCAISSPNRLNSFEGGRARCPTDGSDLAHCSHKVYTGCFLHLPGMGVALSGCDECFCELRARDDVDGHEG